MIKVGLQIPNFTYPGVAPEQLFERVAEIAVAGEEAGADTVMVMDHFYQLPLLGPPEHEMFEAYTLLGASPPGRDGQAGHARHRGHLPQPATWPRTSPGLDVISGVGPSSGSARRGSTWEHAGLGVDFPPVKERFERLEEALQICRAHVP